MTKPRPEKETAMNVNENLEAGFVEFINSDVPYIVREIDGKVAILLDMETRNVIGYRVYDAATTGKATGEAVAMPEPLKAAMMFECANCTEHDVEMNCHPANATYVAGNRCLCEDCYSARDDGPARRASSFVAALATPQPAQGAEAVRVKDDPNKEDRFAYWNSLPEEKKAKIRQDWHNDMYGGADD
jgi:hypothetical protein